MKALIERRLYGKGRQKRPFLFSSRRLSGMFNAAVIAYGYVTNSRMDATMYKKCACTAALAGVLLSLPLQSSSQTTRQAKPPIDPTSVAAVRFGEAQKLERSGDWAGKAQTFNVPLKDLQTGDIDSVAIMVQSGVASAPKVVLGAAHVAVR